MPKSDSKTKLDFTSRVHTLFASIFSYHFNRKARYSKRTTPFGDYTTMIFRKAAESPVLQLLKEEMLDEFESVEILVKSASNRKVGDTDLESVIMSVRERSDTLFILATTGEVYHDYYERLFRVFTRYQVIILPLGEDDISNLEKYVKDGNINACMVILSMLANRIASEGERLYGMYAERDKWQKAATAARLDGMAQLQGPQVRTLVKKLHFLLLFEKAGLEVAEACRQAHISRKLFYLWCEKDPIFRDLLRIKTEGE